MQQRVIVTVFTALLTGLEARACEHCCYALLAHGIFEDVRLQSDKQAQSFAATWFFSLSFEEASKFSKMEAKASGILDAVGIGASFTKEEFEARKALFVKSGGAFDKRALETKSLEITRKVSPVLVQAFIACRKAEINREPKFGLDVKVLTQNDSAVTISITWTPLANDPALPIVESVQLIGCTRLDENVLKHGTTIPKAEKHGGSSVAVLLHREGKGAAYGVIQTSRGALAFSAPRVHRKTSPLSVANKLDSVLSINLDPTVLRRQLTLAELGFSDADGMITITEVKLTPQAESSAAAATAFKDLRIVVEQGRPFLCAASVDRDEPWRRCGCLAEIVYETP